jgi:hypothetical protein
MMTCPKCQREGWNGDNYCDDCGVKLMEPTSQSIIKMVLKRGLTIQQVYDEIWSKGGKVIVTAEQASICPSAEVIGFPDGTAARVVNTSDGSYIEDVSDEPIPTLDGDFSNLI